MCKQTSQLFGGAPVTWLCVLPTWPEAPGHVTLVERASDAGSVSRFVPNHTRTGGTSVQGNPPRCPEVHKAAQDSRLSISPPRKTPGVCVRWSKGVSLPVLDLSRSGTRGRTGSKVARDWDSQSVGVYELPNAPPLRSRPLSDYGERAPPRPHVSEHSGTPGIPRRRQMCPGPVLLRAGLSPLPKSFRGSSWWGARWDPPSLARRVAPPQRIRPRPASPVSVGPPQPPARTVVLPFGRSAGSVPAHLR